jgi:hypothetical protein
VEAAEHQAGGELSTRGGDGLIDGETLRVLRHRCEKNVNPLESHEVMVLISEIEQQHELFRQIYNMANNWTGEYETEEEALIDIRSLIWSKTNALPKQEEQASDRT